MKINPGRSKYYNSSEYQKRILIANEISVRHRYNMLNQYTPLSHN